MSTPKATPGIDVRHSKRCCTHATAGRCDCTPTYQAHVFDARTGKRVRKTFPTKAAAKLWRSEAVVAARAGKLEESKPKTTVREACEAWLVEARAGIVRTRKGTTYAEGTLRAYETHLRVRVYPTLGAAPFYRVRRADLQLLVDRHVGAGVAPATLQPMMGALGAVYGRALRLDKIEVSPTANVKLLAIDNGGQRFATPTEAAMLLAAAPGQDRAIWATAMYTGLRRGELQALRWEDVDFDAGKLLVVHGWDRNGQTTTKNRERRHVPISHAAIREHLVAQRLRQAPGIDLVFGIGPGQPFGPDRVLLRAYEAWKAAGLDRLALHDCRHTFASLAIAAGANAKALSVTMGHSSIAITLDRYGHLMPGAVDELGALLDTYLEASG